jgi:hypothetical protein
MGGVQAPLSPAGQVPPMPERQYRQHAITLDLKCLYTGKMRIDVFMIGAIKLISSRVFKELVLVRSH